MCINDISMVSLEEVIKMRQDLIKLNGRLVEELNSLNTCRCLLLQKCRSWQTVQAKEDGVCVELLPGLFIFAFGITIAVQQPYQYTQIPQSQRGESAFAVTLVVIYIVIGLILLGVTILGYFGAIKGNKVMLFVYSAVMVLSTIGDIVGLVLTDRRSGPFAVAPMIVHLVITWLAVALAVTLALKSSRASHQGTILSPPPASYTPRI